MTAHHTPSNDPETPNDGADFEHTEQGEPEPRETDIPIELFLLSDEGQVEMEWLYRVVDNSDSIILSLIEEIKQTFKKQEPNIYSHFIHEDGGVGLTRLELVDLYNQNPLIQKTMQVGDSKHHMGDKFAQQMYTFAFRIFMNMVRYEWLNRTYDPDDERWSDRASRLGNYNGPERHMNLDPGAGRTVIVKYENSPSDYLDSLPD